MGSHEALKLLREGSKPAKAKAKGRAVSDEEMARLLGVSLAELQKAKAKGWRPPRVR